MVAMRAERIAGMVIAMGTVFATCGGGKSGNIHKCAGAGRWFPASATELRREVERFLDSAKVEVPKGRVVAVVAPHAGYAYCGPVAGYTYGVVRGKSYKRVIILALSHSYPIRGLSVLDVDAYETPLGLVPVDRECVRKLLEHNLVQTVAAAHAQEHSDENQLPFLQVALKPGWKLVSVFVGQLSDGEYDQAAKLLKPFVTDETLIVVSSDFTHLRNAIPEKQNKYDLDAAELLVAKDFRGFLDYVRQDPDEQGSICGQRPLALLLKLLDEDCTGRLLKHMTSGQLTGMFDYSVGYCAIAYTKPAGAGTQANEQNKAQESGGQNPGRPALQSDRILSDEEEQTLLRLARATLSQWIERGSKQVDLSQFNLTEALKRKAGVFVTLHENGRLRGCIGYIEPIKPLYEAVMDNARNAATNDPRFPAVTARELDRIDIEISVMSPLRQIETIDEIVIGKHGLVIEKGLNRGVFLPQVPVEQGWNLQQYLEGICRKAFLPPDAWKKGAKLYVFTAQVFGEKPRHGGGGAK